MRDRMASRCGPILGASQMIVASTCSARPPAASTSERACCRNCADAAPRQRASLGGKWLPISPAPMQPSLIPLEAEPVAAASVAAQPEPAPELPVAPDWSLAEPGQPEANAPEKNG